MVENVFVLAAALAVAAGGLGGALRARAARRWQEILDAYADREITRHRRTTSYRPTLAPVGRTSRHRPVSVFLAHSHTNRSV